MPAISTDTKGIANAGVLGTPAPATVAVAGASSRTMPIDAKPSAGCEEAPLANKPTSASLRGPLCRPRVAMKVAFARANDVTSGRVFVGQAIEASPVVDGGTGLTSKLQVAGVVGDPGPQREPASRLALTLEEEVTGGPPVTIVTEEEAEGTTYYHEGTNFMSLDDLRDKLSLLPEFDTAPAATNMAAPGENTPVEIEQLRMRLNKPIGASSVISKYNADRHEAPGHQGFVAGALLVKVYELLKALLNVGIIR